MQRCGGCISREREQTPHETDGGRDFKPREMRMQSKQSFRNTASYACVRTRRSYTLVPAGHANSSATCPAVADKSWTTRSPPSAFSSSSQPARRKPHARPFRSSTFPVSTRSLRLLTETASRDSTPVFPPTLFRPCGRLSRRSSFVPPAPPPESRPYRRERLLLLLLSRGGKQVS